MGCFNVLTRDILSRTSSNSRSPDQRRKWLQFLALHARKLLARPAIRRKKSAYNSSVSPSSTISMSAEAFLASRQPDRIESDSSLESATAAEPYVERFVAEPEEDGELKQEISRRQNSFVLTKVIQYDQLHVKSMLPPALIEVQGSPITPRSQIYHRVQSFEQIHKESQESDGPSLEELHRRRDSRVSQLSSTSTSSLSASPPTPPPVISEARLTL